MENSYKFFNNPACKYFPCHKTENPDEFNCLTCFCPLFAMGDKCGGKFEYSEKGMKSCMNCDLPHQPEYYDTIIAKLKTSAPSRSPKEAEAGFIPAVAAGLGAEPHCNRRPGHADA